MRMAAVGIETGQSMTWSAWGDSRLQIEDLLASHSDLAENATDPANRRGGDCDGAL